eukprot:gnl/TRDRNA2_/TRDRNA2_87911_c1_seq2.p2 gnl/TRDRNA2_/TRDRNA2_87911_c1~~gnl/TRDRNA2_/TRDRNA2_87911_c1_seq2.p2  ORF type:complete len:120 (-),score=11.55 gnl/TRDRNA2_/TRDRNA2_87911_c1_seq2:8-367(-)
MEVSCPMAETSADFLRRFEPGKIQAGADQVDPWMPVIRRSSASVHRIAPAKSTSCWGILTPQYHSSSVERCLPGLRWCLLHRGSPWPSACHRVEQVARAALATKEAPRPAIDNTNYMAA